LKDAVKENVKIYTIVKIIDRSQIKSIEVKLKAKVIKRMMQMNIEVTELLAKTLENMVKSAVRRSVEAISSRHGLDLEAELEMLGLDSAKLTRKAMPKSSKVKAVKVVKVKKSSSFPLPFSAEHVNESCCQGISYNRGLFTQCEKSRMDSGAFCKSCQSEADGSASGKPSCGTVADRLAAGLYEYTDTKGRKPLPYLHVLEKLKLTLPEDIEIEEEHLTAKKVSKSKKSESSPRGRPKKAALSVTVDDQPADLFSQLQPEEEEEEEQEQVQEEKPSSKSKKLSEAEKAEKKAALEAEKAAKLAEKKAALEAERAAKKSALEAERVAKLAEKKAALEAEKEAKKAALEAEKEAKKAALEAEKEAKKAAKPQKAEKAEKKGSKKAEKKTQEQEQVAAEEPAKPSPATTPTKVSASRVKIDGVEYLKTGANILYNPATKEAVGLWNPATKEIEELPEDSDEEEEEDYESDEEN
jgi:hypothetical protein